MPGPALSSCLDFLHWWACGLGVESWNKPLFLRHFWLCCLPLQRKASQDTFVSTFLRGFELRHKSTPSVAVTREADRSVGVCVQCTCDKQARRCLYWSLKNRPHFFSIYILFPLSFYSKRYNLLRDFGLITMYHLPLFTDVTLSPISPRYFPAECCSQPLWVPSGSSPPFSATQGFAVLSSDTNLRFSSDGLWTGNDLSCLVH